jgi:hypothetical protein
VETRPLPFLAALIVVAGIVWIHAGRGIAFFGDEWDFLHGRRSNATEAFLVPHNEHLVVALVAYFKLMWAAVGLENYWPYVVANVLVHLAGVALVFELFRRRAGVMVAFAAAALLAFFGRGYSDVLWDFQIAFMAAVVFGIAAFMLVQRRGLTRAVLATILLALAVAWAAWGVAFALVIALQLVLERSWRRLAVPLVPLGLYAAWFQHWASDRANVAELTQVPRFVADAFAGTLANLGGLPLSWGRVLAFVVVAALVLWLVRVRRPAPVQVAALALPLVGFLMTAAGRAGAGTATEARYAWPFAVFVLFAAAYVLPPVRLDRRALAVLATLVTGAVASNLATLHDASARNRADADSRLAQLGALDLAREAVAPDFVLGPVASFGHFRADRYYSATADYGRPGYDEGRLLTLNATARSLADSANLRASAPRLLPRAKAPGPCSKLPPTAPGPPPELALPGDGLLVVPAADQEVRITYRRFGPTYLEDQPSVITVRTGLVPPPTRAQTPWTLRFESRAPFKLCPAPA